MEEMFLLCVFTGSVSLLFVLLGCMEKWIPAHVIDRLVCIISGEKAKGK